MFFFFSHNSEGLLRIYRGNDLQYVVMLKDNRSQNYESSNNNLEEG